MSVKSKQSEKALLLLRGESMEGGPEEGLA